MKKLLVIGLLGFAFSAGAQAVQKIDASKTDVRIAEWERPEAPSQQYVPEQKDLFDSAVYVPMNLQVVNPYYKQVSAKDTIPVLTNVEVYIKVYMRRKQVDATLKNVNKK